MKSITKHVINSALFGMSAFLGSSISELSDHGFNQPQELLTGLLVGLAAAGVIFIAKFQVALNDDYNKKYKRKVTPKIKLLEIF